MCSCSPMQFGQTYFYWTTSVTCLNATLFLVKRSIFRQFHCNFVLCNSSLNAIQPLSVLMLVLLFFRRLEQLFSLHTYQIVNPTVAMETCGFQFSTAALSWKIGRVCTEKYFRRRKSSKLISINRVVHFCWGSI